MNSRLDSTIDQACTAVQRDPSRLIDVLHAVQSQHRCVNDKAIDKIAKELAIPRVTVEGVVTFYAFFSKKPKGRIAMRLSSDVIDKLQGADAVGEAIADELGIEFGQTTDDGLFSLDWTSCIGMCDQAPAAMVNDVIVSRLTPEGARQMIVKLREHEDPRQLVETFGDGNNAHRLVHAMVENNIQTGCQRPIVFGSVNRGEAIRKALGMNPAEVIRVIKTSRLRGRGGAGFPCGMKWEFARAAEGDRKIVICNADEGEPGTFKDRVLLTELADRIFAGMTIAGYAIGAAEGIVYLRAEYAYLRRFLENVLAIRRRDGWLGKSIAGKQDYDFDIRIQLGAGAYVCGEETALISSAEGLRGEPKNRPPFPAQKGYLGCPTIVNNCETLCCVTKILEEGPGTFQELGTRQTSGTKLLSVSGDCANPGVYEFEFGVTLRHVLETVGAQDSQAVQVGGPSGELVGPEQFGRILCFDDLGTGGAIMCFNRSRDLLEIVHAFMEFFVEESCGYCTPCRVGNTVLLEGVRRVRAGRGQPSDLTQFEQVGRMMKACSRCGLGQTSWRPVVTSLQNFRSHYESLVQDDPDGYQRSFDLKEAVAGAERLTGRKSTHT
jgi:[NiFe] hydrogenase diaphorase moiety large subunit